MSKIARQLVTVVLTGDGGDEVLGGYPGPSEREARFDVAATLSARSLAGRRGVAELCSAAAAAPVFRAARRAHRVLESAEQDFVSRLLGKQIGFSARGAPQLLGGNPRVRPAREFINEALAPARARDGIGLLNYWLHTVALPERYLCKVDRCSMAHSLESRVPFLDPRLVELLAAVSPGVKMRGLTRKSILRSTIGRQLPGPLLEASKRGFDPPMDAWLEQDSEGGWSELRRPSAASGLFSSEGACGVAVERARASRRPDGRVGSVDACRPVEHRRLTRRPHAHANSAPEVPVRYGRQVSAVSRRRPRVVR